MNFGASHTLIRDTMKIRVSMIDDLYFWLAFQDQGSGEYAASGDIKAGCTAAEMKEGIKQYYKDRFGTDPNVSRDCYDTDGNSISCSTEIFTDGICTDLTGANIVDCRVYVDGRGCLDLEGNDVDCSETVSGKFCYDQAGFEVDCDSTVDGRTCFDSQMVQISCESTISDMIC